MADRREWGRMGGKHSLEAMTKAARIARAYHAGVQGGRPVRIDRAQVAALRDTGKETLRDRRGVANQHAFGGADPQASGESEKRKVKRKQAG